MVRTCSKLYSTCVCAFSSCTQAILMSLWVWSAQTRMSWQRKLGSNKWVSDISDQLSIAPHLTCILAHLHHASWRSSPQSVRLLPSQPWCEDPPPEDEGTPEERLCCGQVPGDLPPRCRGDVPWPPLPPPTRAGQEAVQWVQWYGVLQDQGDPGKC